MRRHRLHHLGALSLALLASGPASAQGYELPAPPPNPVVLVQGVLEFAPVTLTGAPLLTNATSSPSVQVQFFESSGFRLVMRASDLSAGPHRVLRASAVRFRASGGTLVNQSGGPSPSETGSGGDLASGVTVLAAPPGVTGSFDYSPSPASFVMQVPVETLEGSYRGTLVFTLYLAP